MFKDKKLCAYDHCSMTQLHNSPDNFIKYNNDRCYVSYAMDQTEVLLQPEHAYVRIRFLT